MRPRLLALLAVLVLTPLAAIGWLGTRMAADARAEVEARYAALVDARLADVSATVERAMGERERGLLVATAELPTDPGGLRALARSERRFSHLLVFGADGRLDFPPPQGPVSDAERAFLERTRGLWEGRGGGDGGDAPWLDRRGQPEATGKAPPVETGHGWHIWYWGGGLNLLFWRRLADQRLVAVEVDRVRLLADIVAALPSTEPDGRDERTALLDASGRPVYQWGRRAPDADEAPRRTRPLAAPLQAWQLAWYGPPPTADGLDFNVLAGLAALALALVGLATWFYRESSRALRQAAQRATFVNQVSHELKTPLTNIRMYAELLEDELLEEDEKARRYLGILTRESQRLSRLVSNILSFARQQRERLSIRRAPASLDAVVREVLDQFAPSLAQAGVAVETDLAAPDPVALDADAVEQILSNLLSNAEKYAPQSTVRVQTAQRPGEVELVVRDGGPGIPRGQRKRVFEAFHRVSNALTDGVSGTGIGLSISRDLARLHGGDLELLPSEEGAAFRLILKTEPGAEP